MENNIDTSTKAYYESKIEQLVVNKKVKLSNDEICDLTDSIINALWKEHEIINIEDSYDVVYNKIHEKYGI